MNRVPNSLGTLFLQPNGTNSIDFTHSSSSKQNTEYAVEPR